MIRRHSEDLTKLKYMESSNKVSNAELFVGDSTAALIVHLNENEGYSVNAFYTNVFKFYSFVRKQLKVFDFKSSVVCTLSFLDPSLSQKMSVSTFDVIANHFPISFDKSAVKLEYREYMIDALDTSEGDAMKFWLSVSNMKSPMGAFKYQHLGTLALELLSIPVSNAYSERAFSLAKRIKTVFRPTLATETLSALIGCHFNKTAKCCEMHKFEESLLKKAKQCTRERNCSYKKND